MNIAIIGATGFIGSAIMQEALSRHHQVTALVSRPERLTAGEHLSVAATDVQNATQLAEQLRGFDAVISAFSGHASQDVLAYYVSGMKNIIAATRLANVPRLLVVGGAGSLEVAPGQMLIDTPDFPAQYKASAEGARQALQMLRAETALNWTMLSPSAMIAPGQRSGQFRLGGNQLLVDADGQSHISVQDFALAMIDELEKPAHLRQRFTVGY